MTEKLKKIFYLLFIGTLFLSAGKKYPEWFLFPEKYPQIVTGYNYCGSDILTDAAVNYTVLNHSIIEGSLHLFSDTEKRLSDYFYYYDKDFYRRACDSLKYLDSYVINTLPVDIIAAYSMYDDTLVSKLIDIDTLSRPDWTAKNYFMDETFYYGVGVYTAIGNDVDAWKTAEEHSLFALVTGYRTNIKSIKKYYKSEFGDCFSKMLSISCKYSLKNVNICQRYHDYKYNLFFVLTKTRKSNIKMTYY